MADFQSWWASLSAQDQAYLESWGYPGPDPYQEVINCPPLDGDVPTFYPDPTDPNRYFECHGGTPYSQPCPEGLVWEGSLKVCLYLNQVSPLIQLWYATQGIEPRTGKWPVEG